MAIHSEGMRRPILSTILVSSLTVLLILGCQSHKPYTTCRLMCREIHLTPKASSDDELGIRLMKVEPDGGAVISVTKTREILKAMPGEPFLGRYARDEVRTFGEHGLTVQSTSVAEQSATLNHTWAE